MLAENIKPEIERALESRKLEFGRMMKEFDKIKQSGEFNYSKFWGFTHLLIKFIYDLSPKNLALIRQHTMLASTGIYPLYDYKGHRLNIVIFARSHIFLYLWII